MSLLSPLNPDRLRIHPETGEPILHRTFPDPELVFSDSKKVPKTRTREAMITQMRLYRTAYRKEIPQLVAISDLYEHTFWDHIVSKFQMGRTVIASLIYEPRILKNTRRMEKAKSCYIFRTDLDLLYGLEWQICTWIRSFLSNRPKTQDETRAALKFLATVPENEYVEFYENRVTSMPEVDWTTIVQPSWVEDVQIRTQHRKERPLGPIKAIS